MVVSTGRQIELTRDLANGRPKDESVRTPEEAEAWDATAARLRAALEANPDAIIDVPYEYPDTDLLSPLWGAPVTDEQIAAAGGAGTPTSGARAALDAAAGTTPPTPAPPPPTEDTP